MDGSFYRHHLCISYPPELCLHHLCTLNSQIFLSRLNIWSNNSHLAFLMILDNDFSPAFSWSCSFDILVGNLMSIILLNYLLWNASRPCSTLNGTPYVWQLYSNTDLTNALHDLIFFFCFTWLLDYTDCILFIATIESCFHLLMPSSLWSAKGDKNQQLWISIINYGYQ